MASAAGPLITSGVLSGLGSAAGGKKANKNSPQWSMPPDLASIRDVIGPELMRYLGYSAQKGRGGRTDYVYTGDQGGRIGPTNSLTEATWSRMGEILNPDYWKGMPTDPNEWYNKTAEGTRASWETDLGHSLDSEQARLGGQYGIRFGTDVAQSLGRTRADSLDKRTSTLASLWPSFLQASMQAKGMQLGAFQDIFGRESNERLGGLDRILGYATAAPGTSYTPAGLSPLGMGLQAAGNVAAQYPLYQYMMRPTTTVV